MAGVRGEGSGGGKARILDGCCGEGGAGEGYARAGFEVVGVDLKAIGNYPHEFHRADILSVLRGETMGGRSRWRVPEDFDAIHVSPPCPAYSSLKALHRDVDHPELIEEVRELLEATGLPYVIENVVGAPLINPIQLCGSSFGLDVRRHRLFETNFPMMALLCAHNTQTKEFDIYEHGRWIKSPVARVYGHGGGKARDHWAEAMGIEWMTHKGLAQAIPPAYTEFIGGYLLTHLAHLEKAALSHLPTQKVRA